MKAIVLLLLLVSMFFSVRAQGDFADPVSSSAVANIGLPPEAYLVRPANVPANIKQLLGSIFQTNPAFQPGKSEVIVFAKNKGKSPATAQNQRAQIETSLRNAGWEYEITGQKDGIDYFTAIKRAPVRRNIFGFWLRVNDGGLIMAMTEVMVNKNSSPEAAISNSTVMPQITNQKENQTPSNAAQTLNLAPDDMYINVMGNKMPTLPTFSPLPKKAGVVRGYVKDWSGKPLEGAYLGVRSTLVGGSYSGASAVTDAKGYYEIKLPFGAIHFYAAAYTIDYGEVRAALSLHPVDGRIDGFASADGSVENFVMLPFGIADRDLMSDKPGSSAAYYGGVVSINYNLAELNNSYAPENYIKENSEIEITLTPTGTLIDGSAGQTFTIRKNVGNGMLFNILNIPLGKYTISARLVKANRPLFMKQSVRNKDNSGIKPKEATGSAELTFEPNSAQTVMIKGAYGSWNSININLFLSK